VVLKTVFATLLAAGLAAVGGTACIVFGGLYDVSATAQHTRFVYALMERAMLASVRLRARGIEAPAPSEAALVRGAACYRSECLQCHGAPGVAPEAIGKSMQPHPGPLVDAARRWRERELYWITRHGIKMTGMPAWEMRLSEADLWAVTGFVARLPELSPEQFQSRLASAVGEQCAGAQYALSASAPRPVGVRAERERGARALRQYACIGCHTIPGLTGPDAQVGPPLQGLASRSLIAGRLPNTEDNLVRWIRAPNAVKPGTAMPDMGVTEAHAREIATYLSTLH
jgi:mono/diheme cytochrome c family protein